MGMDFVEDCLDTIISNDEKQFGQILFQIKEVVYTDAPHIPASEMKWFQDIPVICILYNKPRFLKKIRKQVKHICSYKPRSSLGYEMNAVDLASALGFRKCVEQLLKFSDIWKDDRKDRKHISHFSVFASILNVSRIHNLDHNVIIKCFRHLIDNGFDIHARGPLDNTILHEAVFKRCNCEIFRFLFSLGFDVNCIDRLGDSAFIYLIWRSLKYKVKSLDFIRILTVFLYENVDICLDKHVVEEALRYDREKFPDIDEMSDDECSEGVGQGHPMEHLRLLPRLYEYGFHIDQKSRDMIELPSLFMRPVTYKISFNKPRSLKDSARLRVRAAFPGRRLHTLIKSIHLPNSVRDYILMEHLNNDN